MSDDWNDGANWADGSVPPEKANVTIDTENYNPLIDATYVVNNILIKEGSAMNFAYPTSTLRVSGDFVNNGNFAPAQGRVTFDGIGNRLVKGNNVPVFHGLRLDVQDTLLLLTSINFTGALQPLKGVFNWNNYKVTLTSNVVNTGSIGEIKAGAEILGDSIIYHRFVPTGPGRWRMFCSPLTDATFEQWNDDFPTTGFPGSNFPNHPNAANPWASIRSYDETITGNDMHSGFQPLGHITDLIENGTGYFVYFVPNSTLIDMEGTFKRGSRHWDLDHTDSNDDPYQDGWNLLGNPYPSAIDWDSPTGWTKENIASAVYAYDPVNGQYSTYINGISVGELDGKIASFQAFWVKAEGPNASISINETAKISENGVFMKSNNMQMHDLIRVRLSTASENVFDETVFGFHLNASNEFDSDLDAYKLFATNANLPNIATRLGEERPMGISMLPLPDDDLIIDLYVRPGHYTSFTLTNTLVDSFDDEVCIVLEDAELQTMVAFNQGDAYAFTPGEMDLTQRFKLRVSAPLDVTVFNESCPDSDNGRAIVQGFGAAPWTFTWHDEMGSVLRVTSESSVADVFDDLTPGFYEVMVENSGDHCTSITKLIHVQAAPQAFATAKMSTRSTCNDQPTGVLSLETDEVYNWAITAVPDGDFPTIQFSALPSDTVLTGFFGTPYLITAQNGCGANATLGIYNFSDPMAVEAGITVSSNQVTMLQQGGVVNFFSTSSAAASTLIWDFGDGSTTEGSAQPSHGYEQLGQYTVQLVASNSRCADTAQVVINVTNAGAGTSMAGGAQQQANSDLADKELPALTVTIFSERMRILAEQSIDQKVIVSIFNLTGQRVLHQEMGSLPSGQTEVDVSALNQGLYTYGLQTESTLLKSGEFFK